MANVLVEEQTLINIANSIREFGKHGNKLKPSSMPGWIEEVYNTGFEDGYNEGFEHGNYEGGGGIELPALSGDLRYAFAYGAWDWFLDMFGNEIKTENITDCSYMFCNYQKDELPNIKLNFAEGQKVSFVKTFDGSKLKSIGCYLSGAYPGDLQSLFSGSNYLKTIDDGFFTSMVFDDGNRSTYISGLFTNCYSLRELPNLEPFNNSQARYHTSVYSGGFNSCYVLNKIINLPIIKEAYTSNAFSDSFKVCRRLKDLTFITENGQPIAVAWSKQTIDLSYYVGYAMSKTDSYILNYNSGITQDKYVDNAASFEALKDDPDWYGNLEFSRYNIDSAIRTIASLPDVSAGTSNVIKFKGEAGNGSASDGRKINEMTDAEIAVAAAKGWTVTFA